MAYIINIEISQVQELYKKSLSAFKNNYLSNSYYDDYLSRYNLNSEEDFKRIVVSFLDKYKWAVFTYFTTYHTKYITFVTNEKEIFDRYLKCMGDIDKSYFNIYPYPDSKIKNLRTISFDDMDKEGEFAFRLSKELDKKNPYLICYFESNIEYYRYDYETDECEDFIWYEDDIRALKEERRWFDKYGEYIIYEVTNEYAFLKIWEMASHDLSITQFVLSCYTNLDAVEEIMKKNDYTNFEILKEKASPPWIYGQIYGGGSDEHHAIFYAKDAKYTHKLSSYLEKDSWFSRY